MADLADLPIARLGPKLRAREISPVELVEAYLQRIRALNEDVNAYVLVCDEQALSEARDAEAQIARGESRGPLHGIPIAHKDLYFAAGVRTTACSRVLEDFVPSEDATVVARYRQAGTILLGKLNTHEFAYGTTNKSSMFGPVRNPWDRERHTGGSSGGSGAAVALGMCAAATGSDSGGSIRMPAAACGIAGLKPTFGLGSRHGIIPLMWTMDHPGPMCRTVRDTALMLQPIPGFDPHDRSTVHHEPRDYTSDLDAGVLGLRVGVPSRHFYDRAQPEVERVVREALDRLAQLGAEIVEIDLPYIEYSGPASIAMHLAEAAAYHDDTIAEHPELFTDETRRNIEWGNYVLAKDYLHAQRFRRLLGRSFATAFADACDVIVTPTLPITATPLADTHIDVRGEHQLIHLAMLRNTEPLDLTGLPALSIPCGFSPDGLPIGLQIVAPPFEEARVLRVGSAYEQATDWHARTPTVLSAMVG